MSSIVQLLQTLSWLCGYDKIKLSWFTQFPTYKMLNASPQPFDPLKPLGDQNWSPRVYAIDWPSGIQSSWLSNNAKLIGIGSCFSTNLLRWFSGQGLTDISPGWGRHYNSKSILIEIERCLGTRSDLCIWEHTRKDGQSIFIDALRHLVFANSEQDLRTICDQITQDGRAAFLEGDVIVITLGLSEVWEELDSESLEPITLSRTPPATVYSPTRHRCRFQSANEVSSDIQSTIRLLRSVGRFLGPIILTVCPIPLKATFCMTDARTANWRSKSTLLSAVHEAIETIQDPFVFYYDAFELFWTREFQPSIWQADGRHPISDIVNQACTRLAQQIAVNPEFFDYDKTFEVPEADHAHTS